MKSLSRLYSQIVPIVVAIPLLAAAVSTAKAEPIIRNFFLNGVTFADGASATGSFQYDVTDHKYLGVSIDLIGSGGNFLFTISDLSISNPPTSGDPTLFSWRHLLSIGNPVVIDALQLQFLTSLDSPSLLPGQGDSIVSPTIGGASFYGHNFALTGHTLTELTSGSVAFFVPEPNPLLSIGAALLGLGVLRLVSRSRRCRE